MLNIYIGNLLEELAEILKKNVISTAKPLKKTTICVQTSGMQRWTGLTLASSAKISANLDFIFPAAFIKRMAENHFGRKNLWADKDELVWLTFEKLVSLGKTEYTEHLLEYLKDDPHQIKTFRLAGKIADVFDQYQLYRPQMALDWLAGKVEKDEHVWQAELFREIFSKTPCKTKILHTMIKDMEQGRASFANFSAVHMFGLSVIPPFFIDILNQAAEYFDINLYLLSPTDRFWGDSLSDREKNRLSKLARKTKAAEKRIENYPLLDNLGMMGRDFFENLIIKTPFNTEEFYTEPIPDSLLKAAQNEIFTLGPSGFKPLENDKSVTVASCHNPMRETEALYDWLLDTINTDPSVKPSDILVMATDIKQYAPYIRAVFDNPYSEKETLPYTLADLPFSVTNDPAGVFLDLLEAVTGEFSLSSASGLFKNRFIAEKFGIGSDITQTLERNGAYWGLTDDELRSEGILADTPFTFERAMKRLALGLAEGSSMAVYGEASGDNVPFSMAEELGGVMKFTELAAYYREKLKGFDTPGNWCALLSEMMLAFMSESPESADDFLAVSSCIEKIKESSEKTDIKCRFRPVHESLESYMSESGGAKGFITGRITFCAMLPMRSIPFRIICILGLGDSEFPRVSVSPEFDIMSKPPKIKGDRTQRDSDKYLFLETLISAREKLYLSWVGRSEKDNTKLVPSVLVTELLRYFENAFGVTDLVTEHRLHSFSRQYFSDKKLFSYSSEKYRAAKALDSIIAPRGFCASEIPHDEIKEVDLASFERFFINPADYFLKKTLGISPDVNLYVIPETERMNLDHLEKYQLRELLMKTVLKEGDTEKILTYASALGRLPAGGLGLCLAKNLESEAVGFADAASKILGAPPEKTDIEITVRGVTITGRIENLSGSEHVYIKPGTMKPNDLIRVWIRHCLLNSSKPYTTTVVHSEGRPVFNPLDPSAALDNMMALYLHGCAKPLYFHPAEALENTPDVREKFRFVSLFNQYKKADDDPAFKMCFQGRQDFSEMSDTLRKIFQEDFDAKTS